MNLTDFAPGDRVIVSAEFDPRRGIQAGRVDVLHGDCVIVLADPDGATLRVHPDLLTKQEG